MTILKQIGKNDFHKMSKPFIPLPMIGLFSLRTNLSKKSKERLKR
ncbi:hypothetical protein GCM10008932_17380 [Alkalibacterium iburiense]|uniref:Uncharacterized protein n=1 Tax=Alkalibacterium iburiense TaxID=290589 RepID=A0ABN0XJD8_9LACT